MGIRRNHREQDWGCKAVMYIALLILQPFRRFTHVTVHSPTLPLLYLHHSSFSNPSVASPTSQFILQPFFRFSYVTSSSLNSPGVPPMNVYLTCISSFTITRSKDSVGCAELIYCKDVWGLASQRWRDTWKWSQTAFIEIRFRRYWFSLT